jgi:hypothetical protein
LRSYPGIGSNKPAFDHLICNLSQRGYTQLKCSEAVGLGTTADIHIAIRPNPFTTFLNVAITQEYDGAELILLNSLGNAVYRSVVHDGDVLDLGDANLAGGMYLYEIRAAGSNRVLAEGKLIRQ